MNKKKWKLNNWRRVCKVRRTKNEQSHELPILLKCMETVFLFQYILWASKFMRNDAKDQIIAMETDDDHILISYDTTMCIANIIKRLNQNTTHHLWMRYPEMMRKNYWKKHILLSDGYFARSVGDASAETIQRYIENQG